MLESGKKDWAYELYTKWKEVRLRGFLYKVCIYFDQKNGTACCSDTAISFHYISPPMLYVMYYMVYHLRCVILKSFLLKYSLFVQTRVFPRSQGYDIKLNCWSCVRNIFSIVKLNMKISIILFHRGSILYLLTKHFLYCCCCL